MISIHFGFALLGLLIAFIVGFLLGQAMAACQAARMMGSLCARLQELKDKSERA